MNKVILVGRLTKDPELKKTPSGASVVNFTIAVNRTFANANGEREADFINCVVWGKVAENLAAYQSKGSLIGVDGRIQTRNYEDSNQKRVFITEVVAENIQFIGSNKKENNQPSNFFENFSNKDTNDVLSGLDMTDDTLPF